MDKAAADREFERLYGLTYRYLAAYALSRIKHLEDTDDLLQTVYTAFYKRIRSKGTLDEASARKLLTTSVKHELSRYYGTRKKERDRVTLDDGATRDQLEHELARSLPDFAGEDALLLGDLWEEIGRRGDLTQRLFLLHFRLGYTLKESARALGMTEASATSRIYRTVAALRRDYFAKEDTQP